MCDYVLQNVSISIRRHWTYYAYDDTTAEPHYWKDNYLNEPHQPGEVPNDFIMRNKSKTVTWVNDPSAIDDQYNECKINSITVIGKGTPSEFYVFNYTPKLYDWQNRWLDNPVVGIPDGAAIDIRSGDIFEIKFEL